MNLSYQKALINNIISTPPRLLRFVTALYKNAHENLDLLVLITGYLQFINFLQHKMKILAVLVLLGWEVRIR